MSVKHLTQDFCVCALFILSGICEAILFSVGKYFTVRVGDLYNVDLWYKAQVLTDHVKPWSHNSCRRRAVWLRLHFPQNCAVTTQLLRSPLGD